MHRETFQYQIVCHLLALTGTQRPVHHMARSSMRKPGRSEKLRRLIFLIQWHQQKKMSLKKGLAINQGWNKFNPTSETLPRKKENHIISFPEQALFEIIYFQNGSKRSCIRIKSMKTPLQC